MSATPDSQGHIGGGALGPAGPEPPTVPVPVVGGGAPPVGHAVTGGGVGGGDPTLVGASAIADAPGEPAGSGGEALGAAPFVAAAAAEAGGPPPGSPAPPPDGPWGRFRATSTPAQAVAWVVLAAIILAALGVTVGRNHTSKVTTAPPTSTTSITDATTTTTTTVDPSVSTTATSAAPPTAATTAASTTVVHPVAPVTPVTARPATTATTRPATTTTTTAATTTTTTGAPAVPATLSGQGPQSSTPFRVADGLTRLVASSSGPSTFTVEIDNAKGQPVDTPVNASGPYQGSVLDHLTQGTYTLKVSATASWSVTVDQPRPTTAPALPQHYQGIGQQAEGPFRAAGSSVNITVSPGAQCTSIAVRFVTADGSNAGTPISQSGTCTRPSSAVVVSGLTPGAGYWLEVTSDSSWAVDVTNA